MSAMPQTQFLATFQLEDLCRRTCCDQDVGISGALNVVHRRVAFHVLVVLRVFGIAPLLPLPPNNTA